MIKKNLFVSLYFIGILLLGVVHFSADPDFTFSHLAIHIPAIVGVMSIFFAILVPLLKKRFSDVKPRALVSLHHVFSYTGWTSILLHMIFLFVKIKKYTLYIPAFTDWATILSKSGPIAVILIIIGALALLFRKKWRTFQTIHAFNIIAFSWICVHGIFKDQALQKNIPYVVLLVTMNVIILFLLILNTTRVRNFK